MRSSQDTNIDAQSTTKSRIDEDREFLKKKKEEIKANHEAILQHLKNLDGIFLRLLASIPPPPKNVEKPLKTPQQASSKISDKKDSHRSRAEPFEKNSKRGTYSSRYFSNSPNSRIPFLNPSWKAQQLRK